MDRRHALPTLEQAFGPGELLGRLRPDEQDLGRGRAGSCLATRRPHARGGCAPPSVVIWPSGMVAAT